MIQLSAVGRLTKGAELRTTTNGKSVANVTLACKRKRPDTNGNVPTTFIQCVLWGKPAQVFAKYTQKGALVGVNGELQTRSYDDQQGVTHYVTELVVEDFEFLESKETVQKREEKQHAVPQGQSTPMVNEQPAMNQAPTQQNVYQQPSMNGLSEYGYNQ